MKKSGFTLIELIFVIVIIGVLSAVAVPKFKNLKQSAEAGNVIKVATDAFGSIPSAYVNKVDLEENTTDVTLTDLINVTGKNWKLGTSDVNYTTAGSNVVNIEYDGVERNASLKINCSNFSDAKTQEKCAKDLNITTSETYNQTINF